VEIRDLEFQTVQDNLDRQVASAAAAVRQQECVVAPAPGTAVCRPASADVYRERLASGAARLGTGRLLLLDDNRYVVYDSGGDVTLGTSIALVPSARFANVLEARATLGDQSYLTAAMKLPGKRIDPLGGTYVVLAQPQSLVATAAAGDLATKLLEAGGAALVVAMLLILVVSRSVTRPLTQLAGAAEDIAAGNYSRRVAIAGQDEIGLLGSAFNRMAEAVERARKVQRDFLANVSHELKTPLTSLIGFSQALVDGSLLSEAERTRAATIVHEESERVLRMAQELLDLARVEAGSISLHITAVDLGGQLEQELEMVRPRATGRSLALNLNVPDDIPPVAADPERLHQVLDNLLDNAVKYAPEGSAVNAVATLSGVLVETVISNPSTEHRPDPDRMFDRFYRADPSRSAAAGGVGLGLAISRELVAAMRGRLWADFDDAGNLRVHMTLPASREAVPAPASQPATPVRAASPGFRSVVSTRP
jgi:signal transduction histidine kinase